jgi:ferredoxin
MKLMITFSKKEGRKPIIAQAVKDTGVLINVERAFIDSSEGEALIDVPDDQCTLVRERMKALGASVRVLEHGITLDEDECVDCGACVSVCPREVFSMDAGGKLVVDEERCVICGKCIKACPHRALSLKFE